jgi:hypothetical protein
VTLNQPSRDADVVTLVPRGSRATTAPDFGASRTSAVSQVTWAEPDVAAGAAASSGRAGASLGLAASNVTAYATR